MNEPRGLSESNRRSTTGRNLTATGVILLVGGSVAKRRLFECNLKRLNYDLVGIIHVVPRSLRPASHADSSCWDASKEISDICERFRVIAIIPLIDSVVCQCDTFCARLGLHGNDPATSIFRVDKERMQSACRVAGIRFTLSERVSSLEEAINVWRIKFLEQPIVCKPARSGGGDGVQVCVSKRDITAYMGKFLNAVNLERHRNTDIIVQEMHRMNSEFIVNSVSTRGVHYISDVWMSKSKRFGNVFLYDTQELVTRESEITYTVIEYARKVLTACGVRHGACHTEVSVNILEDGKVSDICLIEVNARIAGEIRTDAILGWNRYDQIYWLLVSLFEGDRLQTLNEFFTPSPSVLAVFLRNLIPNGTQCMSREALKKIRALKSFVRFGRGLAFLNEISHLESAKISQVVVSKTVDLISSPGVVLLVGPSAREDAISIRNLESNSLYHNTMT